MPPKSGYFFEKIYVELLWKSFPGINNSLEPPVFWFSNTLPYDQEEMQKIPANKFFLAFLSHHHGFTNCFEILNFTFSNIIPGGVSTCKILTF